MGYDFVCVCCFECSMFACVLRTILGLRICLMLVSFVTLCDLLILLADFDVCFVNLATL